MNVLKTTPMPGITSKNERNVATIVVTQCFFPSIFQLQTCYYLKQP